MDRTATLRYRAATLRGPGSQERTVNQRELGERGHANLVAYLRHIASTATGGAVAEPPGMLLFAGGHNSPGAYTNGVIRTGAAVPPASTVFAAAESFFGPRRRGFAVWVRGDGDADLETTARSRGLWQRPPPEGNPGVAIDHPPADEPPPAGVEVRRIDTDTGRRDYLSVVAAGYGLGALGLPLAEAVLFSLASLRSPSVDVFVAYRDGAPVAGTMVYLAAGTAGLYWVATVPAERGRRLGSATFRSAWAAGFANGATCAVAQASVLGAPIYLGLGFRVVTRYRRYLAAPTRP